MSTKKTDEVLEKANKVIKEQKLLKEVVMTEKKQDLTEGGVAELCAKADSKIKEAKMKKKMPLTETEMRKVGAEYHKKKKAVSKKKAPDKPAVKREACLCGCKLFPAGAKSRFRPGHDMRMKKKATNDKKASVPAQPSSSL